MKKILFAAFAVTLLTAGCQKTEVVKSTDGPVMTFSTEMKKITKADPQADAEGDANLHAQGFNIWAYADFPLDNVTNVNTSSLIYDGMKGMQITYDSGWKTPDNTQYYWPGTNKSLRFFAISAKDVNIENVNVIHGIGTGAPTIEINNFNVTDGNEDLMVADFRKQHQGQDEKTVHLNFHHTLTKVEFKFKTNAEGDDAPKVYVQELKVTNLNHEGKLTATSNQSFATTASTSNKAEVLPVEFTWAPTPNTTTSFTSNGPAQDDLEDEDILPTKIIDINGKEISPEKPKAPLLKANAETYQTWLMLPHTSITDTYADRDKTKDKLIEITYIIDNRQFVAKFPLAGENASGAPQIPSWDVNQYITYTINLSPNLISFEASSKDWTPQTEAGMNN